MKYMKNYHAKFSMIKSLVSNENPVIFEIGSHYGEDTLRFLEIFLNPKIYCFEPDPRNIEIFKKYVNNENVSLVEKALTNYEGFAEFYQSYSDKPDMKIPEKYDWIDEKEYFDKKLNNSGSSSLKKGYANTLPNSIKVPVTTGEKWLSTLPEKFNQIDLMWVDVQGAESEVIEGFGKAINLVKFIWMEYGEVSYEGGLSRNDTVKMMNKLNFYSIDQVSDRGIQGDIMFVNRDMI